MSSLKTKFFLFSNLVVLITATVITSISIYIYHLSVMKNIEKIYKQYEKTETLNLESQAHLIEKMLDNYLKGLTIIIDHLSEISKNLYKENKNQKIVIFDKHGKVLFDPANPKYKNKLYTEYFSDIKLQKKLMKFFNNNFKGADIFLTSPKYILYLKALKNFPYIIGIFKLNKNAELIKTLKQSRENNFKKSIILIIVSTAVLLTIIAILLNFLSKPYFKLVDNSIKIFNSLSEGNIKGIDNYLKVFDIFNDKEITLVKEGFLKMKEGIGSLILNIKTMTNDINKSSSEVEQTLNNILERLTESSKTMADQLKTTETISASIMEMEKAIAEIKDYAKVNKEIANENFKKAVDGYNSMKNLMNWLNQISELSKKIDDIINIINEISKKTKLLSLNASIEASKAGEHGKGFSIVAEEIRKLADTSSKSTDEIFDHLNTINSKISEGINISEEIYKTLDEIRETAQKNKEDSERVAVAIEQQYTSLSLISDNIIKYNEIAEINNKNFESIISSVEELEATAKAFSDMAEELDNLMKIFKV